MSSENRNRYTYYCSILLRKVNVFVTVMSCEKLGAFGEGEGAVQERLALFGRKLNAGVGRSAL
jgi:hypothetical protein